MPARFGSRPFFRFLHKGLGLKNLADYIEQRQKLLGLTNLDIRTVIDVGANKGRAARRFRRLFPGSRVYCVEPIPRLCRRLEQWAETQGGAVRVFELALARAPSEQPLYVHRRSDILSTLAVPPPGDGAKYEPIPVRVETLDRFGPRAEPRAGRPRQARTPRGSTSRSSAAGRRRCAAPPRSSSRRRSTPTRPATARPRSRTSPPPSATSATSTAATSASAAATAPRCWPDVLFARREAAERIAERA